MPDPALRALNLKKSFGALEAVGGVSLELFTGEVHALIGPNGAGKSTLIELLGGGLRPTSGRVLIGERDVTPLGPPKRALAGLARSYQRTAIFAKSTVFENVRLAAQAHSHFPLSLWGAAASNRAVAGRAIDALATVGLAGRSGVNASTLSHGEQRALEIAMVLATAPRIMLLDEPLAGMGPSESQTMVDLIASLKHGRAILLVEHDMDAVFRLAGRLTVMSYGRVIASGNPAEVRADPAVREAYLGNDELAVQ
jgi:branched-chain amino acid transport system ATP-binding protein